MASVQRFALLGCGKIANKHSEIITNLGPQAQLVSVCDLDQNKSSDFAKKYNVEAFNNVGSMISKTDPDTIVILTPSGTHAQNIKDLSTFNRKLIVEKPLALKLDDARIIKDLCLKEGISLSVVKQNRFNKPIVLLKKYLDEGRLGNIFLGSVRVRWSRPQSYYDEAKWRGTWKSDGGVITNQASHHIDMIQWLMGDVESVFAKSGNFVANIEAEDTAIACLNFKNGSMATLEASTAVRPKDIEGSISVLGTKGSVEVGGFSMNNMKICDLEDFQHGLERSTAEYENPSNDRNYAHREFYIDYLNRQDGESDRLVDSSEALKSLLIIHAIYKSIEEDREVFLSEDNLQSKLGE